MDKHGRTEGHIDKLMATVFVVLALVVVAPIIFGSDGLGNANFTSDAPAWVRTLLTISIGFGLVYLGYRASGMGNK